MYIDPYPKNKLPSQFSVTGEDNASLEDLMILAHGDGHLNYTTSKNEPVLQSIDGKPNEGTRAWSIYYTSKTNNTDNGVSTKQWTPPDIRTLHPDDGCSITFMFQLKSNLAFRLVDQNNNDVGARVEGLLLSNGGTVCDDGFSNNSADAICREMGFTGRRSWRSGNIWSSFQATFDITLDDVSCSSRGWSSCTYNFKHNCYHREDVFLECDRTDAGVTVTMYIDPYPKNKLPSQFSVTGEDNASLEDLMILAHGDGHLNYTTSKNEPVLQSIDGKPNEGTRAWAIYYTSKTNNTDNGVSTKQWTPPDIRTLHPDDGCSITFMFQLKSNLAFRLVDQNNNDVDARVEGLLLSDGGTVCDDGFSNNSADAICREMGFTGRRSWRSGNIWSSFQATFDITLDDVSCSSEGWSSCTYNFKHNCYHPEDVFLECDGNGETLFTLVDSDGDAAGAGELGLLLYNHGTVCDDDFDNYAAEAICVELGFLGATRWTSRHSFAIQSSYEITLDDVRCSDNSWENCEFSESHNCGHHEDVFLDCRNDEGTAQFTLVDSAGEEAGAGELGLLLYNGGTVCDDSFDNNAAEAICVELGFSGATRWNSDQTFSIQRNYDITLDDVRCDGETWTTCSFRNDHNCVHSEDIFLECS